ncbi:Transcription initiation factor IIB, partial [Fragariocoptes setiger]
MNMGSRGATVCCPRHPTANLIEDHRAGDMICPECGLVVGDRVVDVGSEWRTFSNERGNTDPSRVGAAENPLMGGNDLSTMIGRPTGSAGLDEVGNPRYSNRRTMSSSDRTLQTAYRDISNMADRLGMPRMLVDRASETFKKVHESKALRGRSNQAIAAASLYIACRQEGVPRTLAEIRSASDVLKRDVGRCFKLIMGLLGTSVDMISTSDYMSRFCSNLGLPTYVQRAACIISERATQRDINAGRSPVSLAAAAIYMASQASDVKKSQKEISDVAGVAEQTIRQAYKAMFPRAGELFPDDFRFHTPIEELPQS